MDTFAGYPYSFAGFIDYSNCYHPVAIPWLLVGIGVSIGTVVSVIPQLQKFVQKRSNYGMNTLTICLISYGQIINFVNYFCLHSADFVGIVTCPFTMYAPRLVTFLNLFLLWYMYLGNVYLNFIYFDKQPRENRTMNFIRIERKFQLMLTFILFITNFATLAAFSILGFLHGYASSSLRYYGTVLGTAGGVLAACQYLPQMITTCRVKGPGSLSMLLLAIQVPGGLLNVSFMAFANHDHWATWLPIFVAAIQQGILLAICIIFTIRNKHQHHPLSEDPLLTDSSTINHTH